MARKTQKPHDTLAMSKKVADIVMTVDKGTLKVSRNLIQQTITEKNSLRFRFCPMKLIRLYDLIDQIAVVKGTGILRVSRNLIQRIIELKCELRLQFCPHKLVRLYDLIDKLENG